jgi:hypothetical protein
MILPESKARVKMLDGLGLKLYKVQLWFIWR